MIGIAERRLRTQRLLGDPFASALDPVRWLVAVQSQDYAAAKWALAQRTAGATDADLDRLVDAGALLRTHAMRPTWHFVLRDDIRWLLDLTTPRLIGGLAGRYRRLELDQTTMTRAVDLFESALRDGHHLTRPELGDVLFAGGISPDGQRLPHLLMLAEARGFIVSGPRRGKQMTYALMSERAPKARRLDREAALAELTTRYFRGHGPAQIQDIAWWSGLTMGEIREGLDLAGGALQRETIAGKEYWFDPAADPGGAAAPVAHLLPNFDEFTVAYRDRTAVLHPEVPFDPTLFPYFRDATPQGGLLSNVVTIGGLVRGGWRRTLTAKSVRVEVRLFAPLTPPEAAAVESASEAYGRFLQRDVDLRLD